MLIKPEQTVDTNLITALLQTRKGCMSNMAQSCSILLTCTVALLKPHIPPTSLGFSFYRHSASLSLEQSNVSISAWEILVPLATMIAPRQSHTRPGFIVPSGVHSNVIFFSRQTSWTHYQKLCQLLTIHTLPMVSPSPAFSRCFAFITNLTRMLLSFR